MSAEGATGVQQLAEAQAALEQAQEQQARWEAASAAKQAELADLESRVGAEVVAAGNDGDAVADRLTEEMTRLRSGAEIDRRGAQACAPLVVDAERQVQLARQQEVRDELTALQARQKAHDTKLAELLEAACTHDGVARMVVWHPTTEDFRKAGPDGIYTGSSVSADLREQVQRLEARLAAMQAQTQVTRPKAIASLSRRLVPAGGTFSMLTGEPEQAEVFASVYVTEGEGEAVVFELVVDGAVVSQLEVSPGQSGRLEHVVGLVPLPAAPVVQVLADGRVAATLAPHMLGELVGA